MHFGLHLGPRDRAFSSNSWTLLRTLHVPVYIQSPTCKTPVVYARSPPPLKTPIPLRRNATVLAIATAAAQAAQAQAQAVAKDDYDDYDSEEEDDYFLSDVGDQDDDMSGEEMLMYVSSQKRL